MFDRLLAKRKEKGIWRFTGSRGTLPRLLRAVGAILADLILAV